MNKPSLKYPSFIGMVILAVSALITGFYPTKNQIREVNNGTLRAASIDNGLPIQTCIPKYIGMPSCHFSVETGTSVFGVTNSYVYDAEENEYIQTENNTTL